MQLPGSAPKHAVKILHVGVEVLLHAHVEHWLLLKHAAQHSFVELHVNWPMDVWPPAQHVPEVTFSEPHCCGTDGAASTSNRGSHIVLGFTLVLVASLRSLGGAATTVVLYCWL